METLKIKFPYDPNKGLAMLEYLLQLVGGKYNQMALLKLAFFADRYHVRHYARPVSSDEYYALKLGPIPSNLRDIISTERYYPENVSFTNDHEVELKSKDIDVDQFSKSDIEAMNFAVDKFAAIGRKSEFFIANLTHAYPEWDKYRKRFEESPLGREDMDYKDFLLNADPQHADFVKLKFSDPFPLLTPQAQEDVLAEMVERTLAFT
jgi:uncharacterized phage-associated protein